jgi:hypothetical protein
MLRDMTTSTMTRETRVLQDMRHFRFRETRALVFRVVNECRQTVGVCLEEVPFAGANRKHFTDDDGDTFQRAAFGNATGCFVIERKGLEEDFETLATVRELYTIWHAASGHSDRRVKVRRTCAGLMELLNSISQSCQTLPYLQDVGSISEASQTASNDEFQQVEDRLTALLKGLEDR